MWPQPVAKKAIVVAGCPAMAFTQLTTSPATVEYARDLGANGMQIGMLAALPFLTLFMQFVAAIVTNHLRYRRTLWLTTALIQRVILVPLALGPLIWPEVDDALWVWGFLLATGLNHALTHFCTPL